MIRKDTGSRKIEDTGLNDAEGYGKDEHAQRQKQRGQLPQLFRGKPKHVKLPRTLSFLSAHTIHLFTVVVNL